MIFENFPFLVFYLVFLDQSQACQLYLRITKFVLIILS